MPRSTGNTFSERSRCRAKRPKHFKNRGPIDNEPFTYKCAPVCMLPPEILSEIFIFARSPDEKSAHSKTNSPTNVSHVSRSWRQTAISTTTLWTQLTCTGDDPDEEIHNRVRYILRTAKIWNLWLKRSKAHPLKITIRLLQSTNKTGKEIQDLLRISFSYVRRWEDVTIRIDSGDPYIALVPRYPDTLEHLEISNIDILPLSILPKQTFAKICHFPDVTQTILDGTFTGSFVFGQTFWPSPISFLTKLFSLNYAERAVSVSGLSSLVIVKNSNKELNYFFSRHEFPALETLKVTITGSHFVQSPTGICSLIRRSKSRLKSLHLVQVPILEDELGELLRECPYLETFIIQECDEFFQRYIMGLLNILPKYDEDKILCPRLTNIEFEGWVLNGARDVPNEEPTFVRMVASRWRYVQTKYDVGALSVTLRYSACDSLVESGVIRKGLSRYISEGLKFEVIS